MNCEKCGTSPDLLVMMPAIPGRLDGKLDSLQCLECAKKSGMYCHTHDVAHQGFTDGSTACPLCTHDLVNKNRERASTLSGIIENDAREDFQLLCKERCFSHLEHERDVQVLVAVAATSLRRGIALDEVIRQISISGSLDILKAMSTHPDL
jgi:hypothetical protein